MTDRPVAFETPDGPSHMMDGGEPLVYTASEVEKIKAEVRREMREDIIKMAWTVGAKYAYQITDEDLWAIVQGEKG